MAHRSIESVERFRKSDNSATWRAVDGVLVLVWVIRQEGWLRLGRSGWSSSRRSWLLRSDIEIWGVLAKRNLSGSIGLGEVYLRDQVRKVAFRGWISGASGLSGQCWEGMIVVLEMEQSHEIWNR